MWVALEANYDANKITISRALHKTNTYSIYHCQSNRTVCFFFLTKNPIQIGCVQLKKNIAQLLFFELVIHLASMCFVFVCFPSIKVWQVSIFFYSNKIKRTFANNVTYFFFYHRGQYGSIQSDHTIILRNFYIVQLVSFVLYWVRVVAAACLSLCLSFFSSRTRWRWKSWIFKQEWNEKRAIQCDIQLTKRADVTYKLIYTRRLMYNIKMLDRISTWVNIWLIRSYKCFYLNEFHALASMLRGWLHFIIIIIHDDPQVEWAIHFGLVLFNLILPHSIHICTDAHSMRTQCTCYFKRYPTAIYSI